MDLNDVAAAQKSNSPAALPGSSQGGKLSAEGLLISTIGQTRVQSPAAAQRVRSVGDYVGRYRLDEVIGRGAFGQVWKGFDSELNRPVAIKLRRSDCCIPLNESLTFREEARRAALLRHEGIVHVFDVGEDGSDFFIISEYIDGPTLARRIESGPITQDEAVKIVRMLATSLHEAHASGVIHRDIKPSNILLRRDGSPAITDFGLAVSEEDQLTIDEGLAGTIAYMSPEQARGETRYLDGRSDLYSVGVILFQLLTGRLPFRYRNREELLEQIRYREVRSLRTIDPTIPKALDEICLKCLSKEVSNRYATGSDLANDLEKWNQNSAALPRSHKPAMAIGGAMGLVMAATLGFLAIFIFPSPQKNQDEPVKPNLQAGAAPAIPPRDNVGLIPANGPVQLLGLPLEKIVWQRVRDTDFLQQDQIINRVSARSEDTQWILANIVNSELPLRISGRIFMDEWVGTAGLIWTYGDPADPAERSLETIHACILDRADTKSPLLISIYEFKTQKETPDNRSIYYTGRLANKTIAPPQPVPVMLDVSLSAPGKVSVKFGSEAAWTPTFPPPDRPAMSGRFISHAGVFISGKTVIFDELKVVVTHQDAQERHDQ